MEEIDYKIDILETAIKDITSVIEDLEEEKFIDYAEQLKYIKDQMFCEKINLEEEQDKLWGQENAEQNREYERGVI